MPTERRYAGFMQRTALTLALLLSGCPDDGGGGPAGTDTDTNTTGSPTSLGVTTDETGEADDSSSGCPLEWDGDVITVRTVTPTGGSCDGACGASECVTSVPFADCGESFVTSCTCSDDPEVAGTEPTHAVSECFLEVNAAPVGDLVAVTESCENFCAGAGLGPCTWSQWILGTECLETAGAGAQYQFGEDMSLMSPYDDGGVLRFVCEL